MTCLYKFDDYKYANQAARDLAVMGVENVKLVRSAEEFRLTFKSAWDVEKKLIDTIPEDAGMFRTGSSYSKDEILFLSELFFCWHDPIEIENAVRRTRSALTIFFKREGLLYSPASRYFDYDWNALFESWDDEFSAENGFSENLVEVLRSAGIIGTDGVLVDVDFENLYLPLAALSKNEIENIHALLAGAEKWSEAKDFSQATGDSIRAAQLSRRVCGEYPDEFFRLLSDTEGLSRDMLYQRELARAYTLWNMVHNYPKMIKRWSDAANLRVKDYYAKDTILLPHRINPSDLSGSDSVTDALIALGNQSQLESLALQGNQLAAAILADMHRLRMQKSEYPLDAADRWAAIQNGYWPSEQEIYDSLALYIKYDRSYAKKMAHLGTSYWQLGHRKSYSVEW